jgi:rhodanese-related sulfurtransferase
MYGTPSITVEELRELRRNGGSPTLIDVREPSEVAAGEIEGSVNVPLGTLPDNLGMFQPDEEIVVTCKMGGRSAQATHFLLSRGYTNVRNLVGGFLEWKRTEK